MGAGFGAQVYNQPQVYSGEASPEARAAQQLIERFLGKPAPATVLKDNAAALAAVAKEYSPNVRYIKRTQRVSIGFVHDVLNDDGKADSMRGRISAEKCPTEDQKGDLFTKSLPKVNFENALRRIRVKCLPCLGSP